MVIKFMFKKVMFIMFMYKNVMLIMQQNFEKKHTQKWFQFTHLIICCISFSFRLKSHTLWMGTHRMQHSNNVALPGHVISLFITELLLLWWYALLSFDLNFLLFTDAFFFSQLHLFVTTKMYIEMQLHYCTYIMQMHYVQILLCTQSIK